MKAAIEATLMTKPWRRSRIAGTAAAVSRSTASQWTLSMRTSSATGTSRKTPRLPKPALLTRTCTGRAGSDSRASTAAMPWSSARSAGSTSTDAL